MTYPFTWGQEIRFTDGKYKGYNGVVRWNGGTSCEVIIKVNDKPFSVIDDCKNMQDHAEWMKGKSATEVALLPT